MPCHPDRVRRHYQLATAVPAAGATTLGEVEMRDFLCVVIGPRPPPATDDGGFLEEGDYGVAPV